MNADRMAASPAKRCDLPAPSRRAPLSASELSASQHLGTVLVNLQQTYLDRKSTLRIWAKLDDVFEALAAKLGIKPSEYA